MSGRRTLPPRRPSVTERIAMPVAGVGAPFHAHVTLGYDPASGLPAEIFARSTGRTTTFIDCELDDVAVLISVALQHGVPAAALAKSMSRAPDPLTGKPVALSFAAHLVDHVAARTKEAGEGRDAEG